MHADTTSFRFAEPRERKALEELQRTAALATHDYREQILAHPDAIEVAEGLLTNRRVRVALQGEEILGFCTVLPDEKGSAELDGLFVRPAQWGAGVGRALLVDAFSLARAERVAWIEVTANPRAVGFYERIGFHGTGVVQTRFAPGLRMHVSLPANPHPRDFTSERLLLRRVDLRDFENYRRDCEDFMCQWKVNVAADFVHWLQPAERDALVTIEWNSHWMIHRETQTFMGAFGCRKFPNSQGEVEIAYGLAPTFQKMGLATEAVRAGIEFIARREDVRTITALTLPQENPSTRVLTRCGFVQTGTAIDPDEGEVWKWSFPIERTAAGGEPAK